MDSTPIKVRVPALPEPIEIDLSRTAVLIVDMQNAFASKGGMIDKVTGKFDEGRVRSTIRANQRLIKSARAAGIPIIYLRHWYRPDLSNAGGSESPNYYKERGIVAMKENPELKGKFITAGSWDAEIVDALRPQSSDIIVNKPRYSGFVSTDLQAVLETHDTKYLLVSGISINCCVESTIREAFFREYFPILVKDASNEAGPSFLYKATVWNVQKLFGWVTTSKDLANALRLPSSSQTHPKHR